MAWPQRHVSDSKWNAATVWKGCRMLQGFYVKKNVDHQKCQEGDRGRARFEQGCGG